LEAARESSAEPNPPAGSPLASAMHAASRPPALGRTEDALELGEVVERALREHGAVEIECDRERAAGNARLAPGLAVLLLVERRHGELRLASERGDRRLQRLAHPAPVGHENGERQVSVRTRR